jgi:hypothetical protein
VRYGKLAAIAALPHPPNTSQKVPKPSARSFLPIGIEVVTKMVDTTKEIYPERLAQTSH